MPHGFKEALPRDGGPESIAWVATVDAFQLWLYEHPGHTPEERSHCWVRLQQRFGTGIDYSGLEEELARSWHREELLFDSPFTCMEYGIAQLVALQLWDHYRHDRKGTMTRYKNALALGRSQSLPDLFAVAGIRFDFSRDTMRPLLKMVREELGLK